MKNLKSKIRDFLDSEEGRVGVKTPLALGVAAGGLMLAQAFVVTPDADACVNNADCDGDQQCVWKCLDWVWVDWGDGFWTCRVEGMGCE
ncbi:MAG: hypothetical protein OXN25_22345 [Candidatus Poribacteria bacterium]|nr:hypothetical protein [Candidatus Poribacteria bacterium]